MSIFAILAGVVLLILNVCTLFFLIKDIMRMIFCSKKIDATVKSVEEHEHKSKDSKTGREKRSYTYRVYFKYDYKDQTYESSHDYSKHSPFSTHQKTTIKINPLKPTQSWARGDLKEFL